VMACLSGVGRDVSFFFFHSHISSVLCSIPYQYFTSF
jgi:hypothetical protein